MTTVNPTIVIATGATVVAGQYSALVSSLADRGYPTACSDPPSITTGDATTVTVNTDVEFLRNQVIAPLLAAGKDIVVLMHSYGGAYGAAAVEGLSKRERVKRGEQGGVAGLVYVASFCTAPGQSALEALLGDGPMPSSVLPGDKPGTVIFSDPELLYPNLPAGERDEHLTKSRPCAVSAVGTPITYAPYQDPAYEGSIAFICMEDDRIISKERYQHYLDLSGIKRVKTLKGGHGIDLLPQEAREELAQTLADFTELFTRD